MAQIEIEKIIDYLDRDLRKALGAALLQLAPDANIDERQLFREFRRQVRRKCSTWETVPDQYLQK